jgi:vancomycin resistance protein YoaR
LSSKPSSRSDRRRRQRTPAPAQRGAPLWPKLLAACGLGLPLALWGLLAVFPTLLGQVRVNHQPLAVTADEARLRQLADEWGAVRMAIHSGPYVSRLPRAELGARLDATELGVRLGRLGRTGNPFTDLTTLWGARRGRIDLAWNPALDRALLASRIARLRTEVERSPVPGTRTPDGQELPGIPGITINSVSALALVEQALRAGLGEVRLEFSAIAPPRPIAFDDPGTSRFVQAMGHYETTYRAGGDAWGRARNIELAAAALDGKVLLPGGELSFNEVVGERSFERGFRVAPEIANRRVVAGIGGGVCQVAATLHAAAYLGGMEIPVQRPHSRPTRYIPMGLDVMVSWPDKDLRIRNLYPFSVRFDVKAQAGVVSVNLVGAGKAHPVEWKAEITERTAAGVQHIASSELDPGQERLVQKAIDGLKIMRTRTVYLPSGPVTEQREIYYPPNDTIIHDGA